MQRIDLDGAPLLSDQELTRRWQTFHNAQYQLSSRPGQQLIYSLLGHETRRFHAARAVASSLQKLRGNRRGLQTESHQRASASVFPVGYLSPTFPQEITPLDETHLLEGVVLVIIDQMDSTISTTIALLNETVKTAHAPWLFLVDSTLAKSDYLATLAILLAHAHDGDDVVFADESGSNPSQPIFKSPVVGPHTLLSYNTIGRPALLRCATVQDLGGFSLEAGRAFEHDLYLRMYESAKIFHHVAHVSSAGRPASSFSDQQLTTDTLGVVRAAFTRRAIPASVAIEPMGASIRWTPLITAPLPSVDIIIPTRDRRDLLERCITSIESSTTYRNFNIIILDNDSRDPATVAYLKNSNYRVVPCPGPFNYAKIMNKGVSSSSADFVMTLNNDTIVFTPDWLEQLVGLASLSDVGVVGVALLDEFDQHEHDGIVIAPYPQHLQFGRNYLPSVEVAHSIRNVVAVTGAVQMIRRSVWEELDGMDESLRVVMNDVDLCLRAQLNNRFVVFTPFVKLYHHASSSRGQLDPIEDRNRFVRRWDIFGDFQDPYFSESLQILGSSTYFRPRHQIQE